MPQCTLDIVLKQHAGYGQFFGKIQSGVKEIADCYIETSTGKLASDQIADRRMRVLGNGVWRQSRHPPRIIQNAAKPLGIWHCGIDDMRTRKLPRKRRFVIQVARSAIIRNQGEFVAFGQPPQDVKRANFAASIDRKKFTGLDPQHSHWRFPCALASEKADWYITTL